ncbi:putative zinc finger protein [Hibiscus syriacus]|uniref:Zinc finger protein n=1 Tax=Hibiscus syriacus TaxID=106335 RepID=A0A6A3AMH4_HIBSY|nr:putative zinc finger protein [Hibiscus syriacus]
MSSSAMAKLRTYRFLLSSKHYSTLSSFIRNPNFFSLEKFLSSSLNNSNSHIPSSYVQPTASHNRFTILASPFSSSSSAKNINTKVNFSLPDSESEEEEQVSNKELDKSNLPPPYDPFNKNPVIEEPQDPQNLQEVFHNMRGDGLINNAVKMFDALSKDGLTHEALELFAHKEALKSFMRMLASGVAPNAYTYTVLIKGLAVTDAKHLVDAKKYLMEMMGKGMKPNANTYTAVFEAFARVEKVEEAKEFLGQMKEKGFVPDEKDVRAALTDKRGPVFRSVMSILFDK